MAEQMRVHLLGDTGLAPIRLNDLLDPAGCERSIVKNGDKRDLRVVKGGRGRLDRESASRSRRRRLYGGVNLGSSAPLGFQ